jgi:hypothetical protein
MSVWYKGLGCPLYRQQALEIGARDPQIAPFGVQRNHTIALLSRLDHALLASQQEALGIRRDLRDIRWIVSHLGNQPVDEIGHLAAVVRHYMPVRPLCVRLNAHVCQPFCGNNFYSIERSERPKWDGRGAIVCGHHRILTIVAKDFAAFATKIERERREDEMMTNENNENLRTLGGVIAHVITHSMHHRAQAMYIMDRLGVPDIIEGDVLGWEAQARGWGWADGGSTGTMVAG